jgi:hypothetical protein
MGDSRSAARHHGPMRLRPRDRPHPAHARRPARAAGLATCLLAAAGAALVASAAFAASWAPTPPIGARPVPARPAAARLATARLATARLAAAAPTAQSGSPVATVVVHDPVDTAGGFDLTRVQVGRASDGRLRAALTLAAPWKMRDLPADDGPPGSLCLRMWTLTKGEAAFPDRLLCITADAAAKHMRGSIFVERGGTLERVANATLARSSDRTVVARFSQSAIGRPAGVRFAAEATAPGCPRPACIDTAPNAPAVATLTLRSN